ncbi:MAG: amidohydrolase family protein, partial [Dehalococcoidales bacterium]
LWEGLGSLEEGNRADIIIVDTSGPEWHPMIDPVANLIYSASGRSVETVIVDGKVIMEKGNILTVDEGEIGSQVRERGKSVLKRAGLNLAPKWPTI